MNLYRLAGPRILLLVSGAGLLACAQEPTAESRLSGLDGAKGGGGGSVSVQTATPAYGHRGDVGLSITITGSGFSQGSNASWERNGVPDAKIAVLATQYLSSTQLVATIDIAPDAELALYDLAVTTAGGRKGIGTEKFEVTTANVIPALDGLGTNSYAWGINDAGQVVGRSGTLTFFWSSTTGLENLGLGQGMDLDASGQTVVGSTSVGGGQAVMWTGGSGNWTSHLLPTDCVTGTVTGGTAFSVTPDGLFAAGSLRVEITKRKARGRPVVWNLQTGGCTQLALPPAFTDHAHITDLNQAGMSVGLASDATAADRAVVWDSNGNPALLPGTRGGAQAISADGSIIVGADDGRPVYWRRNGTTWSTAIELVTGACSGQTSGWGSDINDAGVIVGKGCDGGAWYWELSQGLVVAATRLSGLGPQSLGQPNSINNAPSGSPRIAGGSGDRAVYWMTP